MGLCCSSTTKISQKSVEGRYVHADSRSPDQPSYIRAPRPDRAASGGRPIPLDKRAHLQWRRDLRDAAPQERLARSEEHTSELQSLMRISYAVFCLKKKILDHEINEIETEETYNETNATIE